jgi:hypothetical protein
VSFVLDADKLAFVEGGYAVTVASRDSNLVASVAKAIATHVSPARDEVTIYLIGSKSATLLRDLKECGILAAAFSQPSTHRTIQLKGQVREIRPVADHELGIIARGMDNFAVDLGTIGYSEAFSRAFLAYDRTDLIAVSFTVDAAFAQTPGPGAGRKLEAGPAS